MTHDELENKVLKLERLVECLMIVREGIQELDGDYIFLYERAEMHLNHRTKDIRYKLSMEKEKHELQEQIRLLQEKVMALS